MSGCKNGLSFSLSDKDGENCGILRQGSSNATAFTEKVWQILVNEKLSKRLREKAMECTSQFLRLDDDLVLHRMVSTAPSLRLH